MIPARIEPGTVVLIPKSAVVAGAIRTRGGQRAIDLAAVASAAGDGSPLTGSGPPAANLGKNGDSYFDQAGPANWYRIAGVWTGPYSTDGGAVQDLNSVLGVGNTTGGLDIEVTGGDTIRSEAASDLQLLGASGYVRVSARKVTSKAFAFFEAARAAPGQSWGPPSAIVLYDSVDPNSDAVVAPTPPDPNKAFRYDPATGILEITEPDEPNEYRVTTEVPVVAGSALASYTLSIWVSVGAGPFVQAGVEHVSAIAGIFSPQTLSLATRLRLGNGDRLYVQCDSTGGAATPNTFLPGANIVVGRTGDGT